MRNSNINQYEINLNSIKKDVEEFDFQIDKTFFENFDQDIVNEGKLSLNLILTKTDLMITMKCRIYGEVNLICDKSLEPFVEEIDSTNTIYFKYGDEDIELDVNLFQIENNTIKINIASHILEFILLEIPFRKLHPKFRDDDDDDIEDDKPLYQTDTDQENKKNTDPRWEGLEGLKNKFNK